MRFMALIGALLLASCETDDGSAECEGRLNALTTQYEANEETTKLEFLVLVGQLHEISEMYADSEAENAGLRLELGRLRDVLGSLAD